MGSGLFYHGTDDDVRLGDGVEISRWFRSPVRGRVCYIPGISPKHRELEFSGFRMWAIRLDDGSFSVCRYSPENQPPKSIVLISRDQGGELMPDEQLEEGDDAPEEDEDEDS